MQEKLEKKPFLQIAIMDFQILLSNKIHSTFDVKLEFKLLNKFYFITLCIKDMNIISFWLFFLAFE